MMTQSRKNKQKQVIQLVIDQLKKDNIDVYIILTSEGSDQLVSFIPGVGTVGDGAFIFTKEGGKIAFTKSIDAQDVEESELFDQVVHFNDYTQEVAAFIIGLTPKTIALNYSETNPACDGLTMGRYLKFMKSIQSIDVTTLSSDRFIPLVMDSLSD